MLTFEQIKELIEMVGRERLNGLEIERSGFRLKIDGQSVTQVMASSTPVATAEVVAQPEVSAGPSVAASSVAPGAAEEPQDSGSELPEDASLVTSPIVGTFYASPDPDSPAYAKVGDHVSADKTVCIVEAMKVFNQIQAEVAGKVVAVLVENGEPVEFGQPLFKIDTSK